MEFKGFTKDTIRQFQESMQRDAKFFRIGDGQTRIRLFVSPKESQPYPFYEQNVHWYTGSDGQRKPLLCTQRTKLAGARPCPLCSLTSSLYKSQKAEQVEIAKTLRPTRNFLQWAFVKGPKDEDWKSTPLVVSMSKTLMTQILDLMTLQDDFVEIYDYELGRSLNVNRRKGDGQYQYIYTVMPSMSAMPVSVDPWKEQVMNCSPILDVLEIPTEEQQKQVFEEVYSMIEFGSIKGSDGNEDEVDTDAVETAVSIGKMLSQE